MEMRTLASEISKKRKKAMPKQNDDGSTIHEEPHRGLEELNADSQPNKLAEALYKAAQAVDGHFDGMEEDAEVPENSTQEMIASNQPQGISDDAKMAIEQKKKKRRYA